MAVRVRRTALFAAYQLSVMLGIMLMPLALLLRRSVGVALPVRRVLDPVRRAYEHTSQAE